MASQTKQFQKKCLVDPLAILYERDEKPDDTSIQQVKSLHEAYLTQKSHHAELQAQSKSLSRQIGEARRQNLPPEPLIEARQALGRKLSMASQQLTEARDKLLDYLDTDKPVDTHHNSHQRVEAHQRWNPSRDVLPPVKIVPMNTTAACWNEYVNSHPSATIYHRSEWRDLIAGCFGHQSYYLYASDSQSRCVGILPLVRLKSRVFGNFLVSMPYFNYGGPIGDSPDIEQQLVESANALGSSLPVEHIEYRDTIARQGMPALTHKVNMILDLPGEEAELWQQLGSKLRSQIKRAWRENPQTRIGGIDLIRDFYTVFSRNMRDLGTPVYGRSFFEAILNTFPDESRLVVVYLDSKPAAAGFLLANKDTLDIPWASTIRDYNRYSINMCLYWEILKHAIRQGFRRFDFGRSSKDAGTYRFKQQWGARPHQLFWHYWLKNGDQLPSINPANAKYTMAINVWKRLPLPVTRWLGPSIVKNIP